MSWASDKIGSEIVGLAMMKQDNSAKQTPADHLKHRTGSLGGDQVTEEAAEALASAEENWETECLKSEDKQHCLCWYDGRRCCRCGEAMNYGASLEAINEQDAKIARAGWNGKGMFVGMCKVGEGGMMTVPFLYLRTVNGDLVPWVPSQTDQLANDWEIVE